MGREDRIVHGRSSSKGLVRTVRHWRHLGRRFRGSLRTQAIGADELDWVRQHLQSGEFALWNSMAAVDRRHSLEVARRVLDSLKLVRTRNLLDGSDRSSSAEPGADVRVSVVAAALLHDVGKTRSHLSLVERVVVTVVGGRTKRFRDYLDHEAIGVELCRQAGSSPGTVRLLSGEGDEFLIALIRRADET